jgi:hypothetical protein
MNNQPEDAIDKTLHALNQANPPEGLESRIIASVTQRVTDPSQPHSLSRSPFIGAWWRGALTGAATAMLALSLVLFAQHFARPGSTRAQPMVKTVHTPAVIPVSAPRPTSDIPCPSARAPHLQIATQSLKHPTLLQNEKTSIGEEPLTAEERELVLLARHTDPKELAILNPDLRAKMDAEDSAKFDQFFAPPPPLPTAGDSE